MNVTADYVDKVAKGIIPPVITTEYKGQYNIIKNNLNNMVRMMSDLLAQTDIIIRGAADGRTRQARQRRSLRRWLEPARQGSQ
jgi:methyl-accepting chemotaxis protein